LRSWTSAIWPAVRKRLEYDNASRGSVGAKVRPRGVGAVGSEALFWPSSLRAGLRLAASRHFLGLRRVTRGWGSLLRGTFLALVSSRRVGARFSEALSWPSSRRAGLGPSAPRHFFGLAAPRGGGARRFEALFWPSSLRAGLRLAASRHFFGPRRSVRSCGRRLRGTFLASPLRAGVRLAASRHFLGPRLVTRGWGSLLQGTFLALVSSRGVVAVGSEALFWPSPRRTGLGLAASRHFFGLAAPRGVEVRRLHAARAGNRSLHEAATPPSPICPSAPLIIRLIR